MSESRKPIAKVTVLSTGGTDFPVLPVAGPTQFMPGHSILVYHLADLEHIKKNVPSNRVKIREYGRSLDVESAKPEATASAELRTEEPKPRNRRAR